MINENVYILASKNCVYKATQAVNRLKNNHCIVKKFNLLYMESIPKITTAYKIPDYDMKNLTGANTGDLIANFVGEFEHLGILITNSGAGAVMRAALYPHIRAGSAESENVAADSRERAILNVLAIPAKFMNVKQLSKVISAFVLAAPDKGKYKDLKTAIQEKNDIRRDLCHSLYGRV